MCYRTIKSPMIALSKGPAGLARRPAVAPPMDVFDPRLSFGEQQLARQRLPRHHLDAGDHLDTDDHQTLPGQFERCGGRRRSGRRR